VVASNPNVFSFMAILPIDLLCGNQCW
jgi:hypothetical protein